jgi:hypothetical protein
MYTTAFTPMPTANADEFPEKGKFAVTGDTKFTTNRKLSDSYGYKIKMSSSEYTGNVAYGLTDWLAPYAKVGAMNVKTKVEDEKIDFGTGVLWGVGGMARAKGLPGDLEARLKAGYESVSGLKGDAVFYGVPLSFDLSMHKVPIEGTLYKDFGKIALEGGVAYENLRGKVNGSAAGYEESTKIKGKDNFGGVAKLTVKPTKNVSANAYYNSIGNTFGGQVTIKF